MLNLWIPEPCGSAGIQQPGALRKHWSAETAHGFSEAGNLLHRFPLDPQCGQQGAYLRKRADPSIIVPISSRASVRVRSLPSISPAIPDCIN